MATVTSRNPALNLKRGYRKVVSDIEVVADTIIIDSLPPGVSHCFLGVQFFADANGAASATPGAGTVDVDVETVNSEGVFESPANNTITGATPTTVPHTGNLLRARATPTGITVATHYQLVWTGNEK